MHWIMSRIKRLYFSPATLTSCLVNASLLDGNLLLIILLSSAEFLNDNPKVLTIC